MTDLDAKIAELEEQLKQLRLQKYSSDLPPPRSRRSNVSPEERAKLQCERSRAYYYKNKDKILARQRSKRKSSSSSAKDNEILANVTLVL
jgi:hypothetical protein